MSKLMVGMKLIANIRFPLARLQPGWGVFLRATCSAEDQIEQNEYVVMLQSGQS